MTDQAQNTFYINFDILPGSKEEPTSEALFEELSMQMISPLSPLRSNMDPLMLEVFRNAVLIQKQTENPSQSPPHTEDLAHHPFENLVNESPVDDFYPLMDTEQPDIEGSPPEVSELPPEGLRDSSFPAQPMSDFEEFDPSPGISEEFDPLPGISEELDPLPGMPPMPDSEEFHPLAGMNSPEDVYQVPPPEIEPLQMPSRAAPSVTHDVYDTSPEPTSRAQPVRSTNIPHPTTSAPSATDVNLDLLKKLTGQLNAAEAEALKMKRMWEHSQEQLQRQEILMQENDTALQHAKEMWMKESSRCTRLQEDLQRKQADFRKQEEELRTLSDSVSRITTENQQLKSYYDELVRAGKTQADIAREMNSIDSTCSKFQDACLSTSAILFEDKVIQIGVRVGDSSAEAKEIPGALEVQLFFGNKCVTDLTDIDISYEVPERDCQSLDLPPDFSVIPSKKQVKSTIRFYCRKPFLLPSTLKLGFTTSDGGSTKVQLRLPVLVHHFVKPKRIAAYDFFKLWQSHIFSSNEIAVMVNIENRLQVSSYQLSQILKLGGSLELNYGIDTDPKNFVATGEFWRAEGSEGQTANPYFLTPHNSVRFTVLCRIEVNFNGNEGLCRICARSGDSVLSQGIVKSLVMQLANVNDLKSS